jgi:hypothetical protein
LLREAGYRSGSAKCIQMYIKGLPSSVAKDVLHPPLVYTYPEILQRAAESVKSQELIASLDKMKGTTFRNPPKPGGWQSFRNNRRPNQPPSQYNSSNAPRTYNNIPVNMDLSRTRGNRNPGN